MSEKPAKYITTTLPYVNADPHVGFALEMVQADMLARYWRLMGHEVFFNTGTDEHGQKIAEKADAAGEDRQAYVDHYAEQFNTLKDALNLSYDSFVRTSSDAHKAAAQALWQRCVDNGYIDKKVYTGLYCVGDEMFLRESDLVNGRCPNHPDQDPVEIEEENYYFKLSEFEDYLLEYLNDPTSTVPEWQRQWAIDFVKGGLGDLSISRPKSRVDWGVPVPGDDEHVMYVWFDALTNYISCLGWPNEEGNFATFWRKGETLQFAGKDQVRFQSIIWQAMLKAADLPATNQIFYHGFITSEGQKMSKSIGNVISPHDMVERYGTDAARYILLRHVHPTDDTDITWEKMDEWYTANLVNGLGNLTARIMKMAETHLDDSIEKPAVGQFPEAYLTALDTYNFQVASDYVWSEVQRLDEKITETEPFKLVKEDKSAAQKIIAELVHDLYLIGRLLYPIMPATNQIIKAAVLANQKPDNLFNRLED
ncbi:methionine--tRNA ligase [bacterium]|nr:methionine--tRNA ligase [bacterium]|tara:strand:+ start:3885 stop:5324 length:1440 start_codon:yes stop_codon:yes gene_type:complete